MLGSLGLVVFCNVIHLSAFTPEAVEHYWLNVNPPVDLGFHFQWMLCLWESDDDNKQVTLINVLCI